MRWLIHFLIFETAFLAAYVYAMRLTERSGAPFWYPDSVLLCALLVTEARYWPLYLGATLPLRLAFAVPPNTPWWFLFTAFANDALKALLAAVFLRRFLAGRRFRFDSLPDFWIYLFATALLAPALSAFGGAASWAARGHQFWVTWRNWYFGDALANVVLTPFLLCLASDWRKLVNGRLSTYLQASAMFFGLAVAMRVGNQRGWNGSSGVDFYHYVPVPFLLFAAVRFGPMGASAALSLMSMILIAAMASTQPESSLADNQRVLVMQLFLMVLTLPIMSLSVLLQQHRKTEHSLRESETRFRKMIDTAPIMLWISDPAGGASFFNRGWLDFTGRTLEQETGSGWVLGMHPDHREAALAQYSSAFDDRRPWEAECQFKRADGQYRWLLCRGAPRPTDGGSFEGYIISASDITDLKNAQEASAGRQKLESLGVLAGGIAHDFNNILGSIHATAEVVEGALLDGESALKDVQSIKTISMQASGIVRQLMMYAGEKQSDVELIDLSGLVKEMLDFVSISVSKLAVLRTDLDGSLPAILGNRSQIQQVVMNLILNASDALAEKGGVVSVKTSVGKASGFPVCFSSSGAVEGSHVILEVSDTGRGIRKEVQSRIFDPFFTTKVTGRGLGLAVVRGVVHAHKGSIELTSVLGEGTSFRVLWPIATRTP